MSRNRFLSTALSLAAVTGLVAGCGGGAPGSPSGNNVPHPLVRQFSPTMSPINIDTGQATPTYTDGMLTVSSFCVDRFEAPNAAGRNPTVMASALDADRLCREVGKRLCTEAEWERACSGPSRLRYPYGQVHEPGRCNDGKRWMRVDEAALASWPSDRSKREADRLWQGEPSGFRPGCSSEEGVQDMVGNVEEWVRRGSGYALKGCYWASCFGGSSPTCTWTNAVHGPTFQFYETGFRCCADKAAP